MFKALTLFRDADGQVYQKGDVFPRGDMPPQARIAYLAGTKNKMGMPVIERVEEPKEEPKRFRD